MELLRTQKNELLRLIVELDLNPDEFELIQQKHPYDSYPFLLHKPSNHSILFERDSRGFIVLSGTPGTHTYEFRHDEIMPDDWGTQRMIFPRNIGHAVKLRFQITSGSDVR